MPRKEWRRPEMADPYASRSRMRIIPRSQRPTTLETAPPATVESAASSETLTINYSDHPTIATESSTGTAASNVDRDIAEAADHLDGATIDTVLAWVDNDPARAGIALDVELRRPTPRTTLRSKLEAIISGG